VEVIIVDDGSNEELLKSMKNFDWIFSYKYIFLPRNQLSSRSRARNYGMNIARGEYYIFIDSDILVPSNYLRELKRCISVAKNSIIIGLRLFLDQDTTSKENVHELINNHASIQGNRYSMEGFRYRVFSNLSYNSKAMKFPFLFAQTCNFAVPASVVNTTRFDEEMIDWGIEDIEFAYRLYKAGASITFNSRMEVYHQFHGGEGAGDFIEEKKRLGVNKNARLFLKKHSNIFGLKENDIYTLFSSLATEYKKIENIQNRKKCIQLEYFNTDNANNLIEEVKKVASDKDYEVHVYDYLENDDLDIIIQHIDTPHKNIRYFPVSKVNLEILKNKHANTKLELVPSSVALVNNLTSHYVLPNIDNCKISIDD